MTLALVERAINVWRLTFVWDVSDRAGGWKTYGCGVECSTTSTYVRNDKRFVFCFGKIVPGALTPYQPSWQQRDLTYGENSVQLPYH